MQFVFVIFVFLKFVGVVGRTLPADEGLVLEQLQWGAVQSPDSAAAFLCSVGSESTCWESAGLVSGRRKCSLLLNRSEYDSAGLSRCAWRTHGQQVNLCNPRHIFLQRTMLHINHEYTKKDTKMRGCSHWQLYHCFEPRRCHFVLQFPHSSSGSIFQPSADRPVCDHETTAPCSASLGTEKQNKCTFIR